MINNILDFVKKYELLQPQDHVVIGVSGGADSVCLLLVLHKLSETLNLSIQPVHINHNLRGEDAKHDENFTVEFCKSLGYQCIVESVDVLEIVKQEHISTEEAGRNVRRRILIDYANKVPNGKVALGHHIDDSVETGIFNLCRGTGIRGLGGIEPIKDGIIRPLLVVRRKEIELYLRDGGQSYCIDASNLSGDYTRNKIRNKIIPLVQTDINDKSVEHIHDTMLELREIADYMDDDINKAYKHYVKVNEESLELLQELWNTHPLITREVIKKALGALLQSYRNISRAHIMAIYELFNLQVGRKISLPQGLIAYRSYEGITLSYYKTGNRPAVQSCIELIIPGQTILDDGRVIETEILVYNDKETLHENDYTKYFDYDIIGDKLFIDKVKDLDYFVINEKGNTQSLKKYTKNQKIPRDSRGALICIRSQGEIQWLFGYRVSFRTKVNTETKSILKIQIGGEGNGR